MDNPEKLATQSTQNKTKTQHHYAQANTNKVNKTCTLLQTTGGNDLTEHHFYRNRNRHHNIRL